MMRFRLSATLFLVLFVVVSAQAQTTESEKLHNLFDVYYAEIDSNRTPSDQLADASIETIEKGVEHRRSVWLKLNEIIRDSLNRDDQIAKDIFRIQLESSVKAFELNHHLMPLNGWWDYYATFAELPNQSSFRNVNDYENYLSKMANFTRHNGEYIHRMEKGIEIGFVRPKVVFDLYTPSVEAHIVDDVTESLLYAPFEDFPSSVSEADRERLKAEGIRIIREVVVPEYTRLRDFLVNTYIPAATETIGITEVPGGRAYYEYLVKDYTTLDLTPEQIHQIGLEEVARIRAEMMVIVEETGFGDDFDGFTEFLRTDPQFYAESPEELLMKTAWVLKKMDGELPRLFKTLPRLPYGIRPIPDYLAPRTTTAYYSRGGGTRAGFYAVNTYNLPARPLYEVEALSFHEAVPGHHLQIALQQELRDLPRVRRSANFTSYVEGWALYSERLGLEVGFYEDPYSNFGRLSYEMWRALRLVVDTGMHAMGWERQQSIDYMAANSALSIHNITTEVDRYIFWPGQALAYKMGEIKITELRRRAEEALGEEFDVREFHDAILLSGTIPLSVLEENIDLWIEEILKEDE